MPDKIVFNGPVGNIYGSAFGSVKSMVIKGGKIYINGSEQVIPSDHQEITINIQGDVERLEVEQCEKIHIHGNAGRVKVNCGSVDVTGDIKGDANVNCGNIHCQSIEGDASTTMGDIHKS